MLLEEYYRNQTMKKQFIFFFVILLYAGYGFAQNKSYQIQKNETLDSLSKKFDVSKKSILELNPDLDKNNLKDEVIVIPAREIKDDTPATTAVQFKEYRVKHKETLYKLAKENDISVDDIEFYNPYLYEEELGEDDMIRIPIFEKEKTDFNKSMQTSNFKNLIHIVMPKETRYGISKEYGMSIDELDSLNPQIDTLRIGQVLKVTNPSGRKQKKNKEDYEFYDVQPKETLYSLAKEFDMPEDSLERLNPILKELGLQEGMELKIPRMLETSKVKGAAKKLDLTEYLDKISSEKHVAVLLPFNLRDFEKDSIDKKKTLQKDQILQMSLDLYSGIKMAVDSIEKMDIPVSTNIFDTEGNPDKIEEIIKEKNFKNNDFVVGPLISSNIEKAAKKLEKEDIAIFSPLTNDNLKGSKKIFQTRPSTEVKEKLLIQYLDSVKNDENILILTEKHKTAFAKKFTEHFKSAKVIKQEEEDYLQKSDLTKVLDKNKTNWVIMDTEDQGVISNAVSNLNAIRSDFEIRLFTPDKNSVYDEEVPSEFLSHLNFTYTSVDRGDVVDEKDTFVKAYHDKYGIRPNSYAVRGFDVVFDALLRLSSDNDIFKSVKDREGTTEYVENRFKYNKGDVYSNDAVYLIQFEDDLKLEIINTLSL